VITVSTAHHRLYILVTVCNAQYLSSLAEQMLYLSAPCTWFIKPTW